MGCLHSKTLHIKASSSSSSKEDDDGKKLTILTGSGTYSCCTEFFMSP